MQTVRNLDEVRFMCRGIWITTCLYEGRSIAAHAPWQGSTRHTPNTRSYNPDITPSPCMSVLSIVSDELAASACGPCSPRVTWGEPVSKATVAAKITASHRVSKACLVTALVPRRSKVPSMTRSLSEWIRNRRWALRSDHFLQTTCMQVRCKLSWRISELEHGSCCRLLYWGKNKQCCAILDIHIHIYVHLLPLPLPLQNTFFPASLLLLRRLPHHVADRWDGKAASARLPCPLHPQH